MNSNRRFMRPAVGIGLYFFLGGIPVALAHRPHDPILDVAWSPDGVAWSLVQALGDTDNLLWSDDLGAHWFHIAGDPTMEQLNGLGFSPDGTLWVLGSESLFWSADDSVSWDEVSLGVDPGSGARTLAVSDDAVLVASGMGLHRLDPRTGSLEVVLPGDYTEVNASPTDPDQFAAVASTGSVLYSEDDGLTWAVIDSLDVDVWDATPVGGVVYIGTGEGVLVWDPAVGVVGECAPIPITHRAAYAPSVPVVRGEADGTLIVMGGRQGPFVSTDQCASWELRDSGLYPEYDGAGMAADPDQAFTELAVYGDDWIAGGWFGSANSGDLGATWRIPKISPADLTNKASFDPTDPHRFAVTQWGGGAAFMGDDGTWTTSAVGLYGHAPTLGFEIYGHDIRILDDGVMLYSGGEVLFRSTDGGATWTFVPDVDLATSLFQVRDQMYAAFAETDGIGYWLTEDEGVSWEWSDALAAQGPTGQIMRMQANTRAGVEWVGAETSMPCAFYASSDRGRSWEQWAAGDGCARIAVWPPEEPTRVVGFYQDGVRLSDDWGTTWRAATNQPVHWVSRMAQADDGTFLVADGAGYISRSLDGGETWETSASRAQSAVISIETAPDFATTGRALLTTVDGVYWTIDAGLTWAQFPTVERMEDPSYDLTCIDPDAPAPGYFHSSCATYADSTAGAGGGFVLTDENDYAAFEFYGTTARIHATGAKAEMVVTDDRVEVWRGAVPPEGVVELTFDPDWHDVRVQTVGAALNLDYVEAEAPGTSWVEVVDTGDTGTEPDDTATDDTSRVDTDTGGTHTGDSQPVVDSEPQDTSQPGGDSKGTCGCASAPGGTAAWGALVVVLAIGRRSSRRTIRA